MSNNREQWGSKLGFILAASGSIKQKNGASLLIGVTSAIVGLVQTVV